MMARGRDLPCCSPNVARQEVGRKTVVMLMVEDASETRAHYPIVGSVLADGVYGGSGGSKS